MAKIKTERISTGVYLKSGSYYAVVRNKWYGPHETPELAQIERERLKAEQASKPAGGPFADFVRDYYYPHYLEKMRENSRITYRRIYENCILPFFAQKKITDIKLIDILDFQRSMTDKNWAPSTINTRIGLLSVVFNAAINLEFINTNPTKGVTAIHEIAQDRHVLTENVIIDLVNKIDHPYKYAIAIIGLAGARIGEVMAFQWADFDFGEKPSIHFRRTINKQGNLDELKTTSSKVQLPMLPDLKKILLLWKEECPDDKWLFQCEFRKMLSKLHRSAHGENKGILNYKYHRKPSNAAIIKTDFINPSLVSLWWSRSRSKYGLSDMRIYDFRHSFATNVVTRCANIKTAQKLCRHSRIETTLGIYAHVHPEQLEEVWDWHF